jgi:hypothetical protein
VLVVMLILGGAQLAVVGVMGEYLWRAVEEVRGRPLYVVRNIWSSPSHVGALDGRTPFPSASPPAHLGFAHSQRPEDWVTDQ